MSDQEDLMLEQYVNAVSTAQIYIVMHGSGQELEEVQYGSQLEEAARVLAAAFPGIGHENWRLHLLFEAQPTFSGSESGRAWASTLQQLIKADTKAARAMVNTILAYHASALCRRPQMP